MAAQWTDLVDPTREDILTALAARLDPDAIELLVEPAGDGRRVRPLLEAHGSYVLAVLAHPVKRQGQARVEYLELDVVATPSAVVTVRKSGPRGELAPIDGITARIDADASPGGVFLGAVDDTADGFLELVDGLYEAIDDLENDIEHLSGEHVRRGIAGLRNELLLARRAASATRGIARRVVDGRVDVGRSELFPADVEARFVDTYETLVRVTEELDVARDLLGGVRDLPGQDRRAAERRSKKLTVIASLVLVPSLIVGFYGQNFAGQFRAWYWGIGVSVGLIVATTIAQLLLFRWRRWL